MFVILSTTVLTLALFAVVMCLRTVTRLIERNTDLEVELGHTRFELALANDLIDQLHIDNAKQQLGGVVLDERTQQQVDERVDAYLDNSFHSPTRTEAQLDELAQRRQLMDEPIPFLLVGADDMDQA